MSEKKKAGGSAPSAFRSIYDPPSKPAASNKHVEHAGMSSDQIAYACEILTKKYNIDPKLARSFFIHDQALIRRRGRINAAEKFLEQYTYGSGKDRKTCIWPGEPFSWQDESSGTMWVGVHGIDSICVVTRSGDLDVSRLHGTLEQCPIHKVLFDFRKSLIVELEDLVDESRKLHQRFQQKIEKPFGVVSVIPPDTNKAPITEYGEMKVSEFLREKMNGDTVFTVSETIQTAISAFQHLFQKKFESDEIQVSVMDPKYRTVKTKDPTVEDLNLGQIKEHLDVINKPHPEDFSSGTQMHREWLHSCM